MSPLQIARLLRVDTLGASVTMVLLGAGTASAPLQVSHIPVLLAVALSFHVYAYLLNDVIDLPVDRTDPRRLDSPLVRGDVRRGAVLALALAQIPLLAALVIGFGKGGSPLITLAVLVTAVSIYDLWGKASPFPPLTDLVQGVAWAALGWLAAEMVGPATRWTVVLSLFFLVFILLANGVHGSIRDLANDRRSGATTTATWFGAQVGPGGGVQLTGAYLTYAIGLQLLTVALAFYPFAAGWEVAGATRLILMGVAGVISTALLVTAIRARDRHRQLVLGAWHLILVLATVFLMLAGQLPAWALLFAVALYVLPFASYRWLFRPKPRPGTHWTVEETTSG